MDKEEQEKKTPPRSKSDDDALPEHTIRSGGESIPNAADINLPTEPRRGVASLTPQSARPRSAQLAQPLLPDPNQHGDEDAKMTAPPSPRPRPQGVSPREVGSTEASEAAEDVVMEPPPSPRPRPLSMFAAPIRSNQAEETKDGYFNMEAPPSPRPAPRTPTRPSVRTPPLSPRQTDSAARHRLETAVRFDMNGMYNQALQEYIEALELFKPLLNSVTMPSTSRKALEKALDKHFSRVAVLEEERVYDETEPERFMVDHSRVPPLPVGAVANSPFRLPGPPASMVRPTLIGEGPTAEDGVDEYLRSLTELYNRGSPLRGPTPSQEEREGTPIPSAERRDSSPTAMDAVQEDGGKKEPKAGSDDNVESSRERAGTTLPGRAENFENRHPKRGLTSYGSTEGSEGRMPARKVPRLMCDHDENTAAKGLDKMIARELELNANKSLWMQELYWNHQAQLHGQLAKDKWMDIYERRLKLRRWETHLLDQDDGLRETQGRGRRDDSPLCLGMRVKLCGNCGVVRRPDGGQLYLCARCRKTSYCTPKCQEDHLNIHLPVCNARAQRRERRQQQRSLQNTNPKHLGQQLAGLQNLTVETDILYRIDQDANRTPDRPHEAMEKLRKALMSGSMDIDEYMKQANKVANAYVKSQNPDMPDLVSDSSSSSSSSSSDDDEQRSPRTPKTPTSPRKLDNSQRLDGASETGRMPTQPNAYPEALPLLSMGWRPLQEDGQAARNAAMQGAEGNDEDAPHEVIPNEEWMQDLAVDAQTQTQMSTQMQVQMQMQMAMYPKRVTDFRIVKDGGRTLEYQVSDSARDHEWCVAGTLQGPAW